MYYPSSENKGADQLRGYREADLRLCFRICKLLVFSRDGSYIILNKYSYTHSKWEYTEATQELHECNKIKQIYNIKGTNEVNSFQIYFK